MDSQEAKARIEQLRAISRTRQITIEEQQETIRLIRSHHIVASDNDAKVDAMQKIANPEPTATK